MHRSSTAQFRWFRARVNYWQCPTVEKEELHIHFDLIESGGDVGHHAWPSPVDSECFRLWVLAFYQGGGRMTLAGKEHPELTPVQTAIAGLLAALSWEHSPEKLPELPKWDARTVVYPAEIADMMEVVKPCHYNGPSPEIEPPWDSQVTRRKTCNSLTYDEARKIDPQVDSWMTLAQNAALRAHTLILEDRPEVDEEGLDEANCPFLKLALEEAIHTVRYTEEGGEIVLEGQEEPEGSEQ
jgi:hypothetical protein